MIQDLPEGWRTRTLGELNRGGIASLTPGDFPDEMFEYYSIPAYQDGVRPVMITGREILSQKLLVPAKCLLFGKLNPRVEKIWNVDSPSSARRLASTEWLPLVPTAELDQAFGYFLLWSEWVLPVAKGLTSGSTPSRQRVEPSSFYEIEVPLPPLAEQRAIAQFLGRLEAFVRAQEQLIGRAEELKRAAMQHLFARGLRGEAQKETAIGPLPESWHLLSCEDGVQGITVGVVVKPASYYVPTGVPALRSLNVKEDRIDPSDLVYFSERDNATVLAKSRVRAGDVLVVRTGYPGTSCVVPPEFDGANCIDLVVVRPRPDVIVSAFLSRYLNSDSGKSQAGSNSYGLAQQHLNVGAVRRLKIPVPSVEEQHQIVDVLGALDRKIALHHRKRAAIDSIFKSLLHKLMTGELRVSDLASHAPTTESSGAAAA